MNWLDIEQVLERFWKGETSLEEEQDLRRAFLREDLPTYLLPLKNYFAYTAEQKNITLPRKDFETQVSEKLNPNKKPLFSYSRFLAYAASLLILISSLFFLLNGNDSSEYKPLTEKELQVAQKYMGLLAKNMEETVGFSNQHLEKFKLLDKSVQSLKKGETKYSKQIQKLNPIEYINNSFTQLKYLKTFETSMKIIAL